MLEITIEQLISRIEWLASTAATLTDVQQTWLSNWMAQFPDVTSFLSEAALAWLGMGTA